MLNYKRFKIILVACLLLASMLLSSCEDASSASDIAKSEIFTILQNLADRFAAQDVAGISNYYDDDYLHDGMSKLGMEELWYDRVTEYSGFTYNDLTVSKNGDYLTARFTITFWGTGDPEDYQVPDDIDDFAYWYRRDGQWNVYGNQHIRP